MPHLTVRAFLSIILACVDMRIYAKEIETRLIGPVDNGPYTYNYCDTNRPECAANCTGGASLALALRENTADHFPDLQITMTETEIQQYKSLRQEYLVAFKKDPLPFEVSLDLPFCGVNESAAEKRELVRRASFWGDIKEKITSSLFSKRPEKPKCVPKTIQFPRLRSKPLNRCLRFG